MKTRNAFAFKDFDGARILQRPYFKKWREKYHVDESKSDAEILAGLSVTDSDDVTTLEEKNSILREISNGLSDLCDMIQKNHADYRNGRLENYRRAVMKKIVTLDETTATLFQARIAREQDLLGFYTSKVLPSFTDLTAFVAVLLAQSEKFLQAVYRRRFGERLKMARERVGLTRKKFADKCGITANALHYYENGQREPSLTSLKRFARTLEVSVDSLLE